MFPAWFYPSWWFPTWFFPERGSSAVPTAMAGYVGANPVYLATLGALGRFGAMLSVTPAESASVGDWP